MAPKRIEFVDALPLTAVGKRSREHRRPQVEAPRRRGLSYALYYRLLVRVDVRVRDLMSSGSAAAAGATPDTVHVGYAPGDVSASACFCWTRAIARPFSGKGSFTRP